jgi:N-acetyl-1-D-myo-inositol-2-amino-2-deoxy-alpha-D-glucopyranoside deacetylase
VSNIVFIHAHPDDEVITTSLTIAKFIDEGHNVSIIHFSKGENGFSYLENITSHTPEVGNIRIKELKTAMNILGVTNNILLGPWPDSRPNIALRAKECFVNENINVITNILYDTLVQIQPDIIITYDDQGYTQHPDHIRVNQVTMIVGKMLKNSGYKNFQIWWTVLPTEVNYYDVSSKERLFMKDYKMQDIDIIIDGENFINKKIMALKAYESQIKVYKNYWTLVGEEQYKVPLYTKEYYKVMDIN